MRENKIKKELEKHRQKLNDLEQEKDTLITEAGTLAAAKKDLLFRVEVEGHSINGLKSVQNDHKKCTDRLREINLIIPQLREKVEQLESDFANATIAKNYKAYLAIYNEGMESVNEFHSLLDKLQSLKESIVATNLELGKLGNTIGDNERKSLIPGDYRLLVPGTFNNYYKDTSLPRRGLAFDINSFRR